MLSRSLGMPSRNHRPAKYLGHTWNIRKRFCKSNGVFFSTLSAGIEFMEFREEKNRFTHPRWRKVKDKNKIKI